MMTADSQLLHDYAREKSEEAFAELVRRHVNLVYSAALRQVRSPQLAEEISQSVFTDLSSAANKLKPGTIVTAWLYQVTRRTAIDVIRRGSRRQARERLAAEMAAMNTTADWTHIEPLLDEAMETLDETDRAAILLRYFENKSLREVGESLGTSDDAAQKRVSHALLGPAGYAQYGDYNHTADAALAVKRLNDQLGTLALSPNQTQRLEAMLAKKDLNLNTDDMDLFRSKEELDEIYQKVVDRAHEDLQQASSILTPEQTAAAGTIQTNMLETLRNTITLSKQFLTTTAKQSGH